MKGNGDAAKAKERAVSELRRYHEEMIRLWGENYPSTPQYERVVEEVANGRYAWMVMSDYR